MLNHVSNIAALRDVGLTFLYKLALYLKCSDGWTDGQIDSGLLMERHTFYFWFKTASRLEADRILFSFSARILAIYYFFGVLFFGLNVPRKTAVKHRELTDEPTVEIRALRL